MIITPDLEDLAYQEYRGVKYFELVAEPVIREVLPGIFIRGWGYNGSIPGPTIKAYPGDCVEIRVYNGLSEPTNVHWHGLDIPFDMDSVQICPGEYFNHRFRIVNPPGTHMYHTHFNAAKQQMMGLAGGFIILDPGGPEQCETDYFIMLQEFAVKGLHMGELRPGTYDIEPFSDDFNFFTINGRSFPSTSPLTVEEGERVRIRMASPASMQTHPMHLHGHQFLVVASDGISINPCAQMLKNTVSVASGETYDVEFIANNPGNWPFHCHIPHHTANNMTPPTGGMLTNVCYVRGG